MKSIARSKFLPPKSLFAAARPILAAFLSLPMLAGCSNDPIGVVPGDFFGGEGVLLTIRDAGADLEWDCAAGEITEPFESEEDGTFDLEGTYTPLSGLPIREGDPPRAQPARYTGTKFQLSRVTLTVEVPESGTMLGPYLMRWGQGVVLRRCL